jgi:uncharacterized protein (TIRG00374 family)
MGGILLIAAVVLIILSRSGKTTRQYFEKISTHLPPKIGKKADDFLCSFFSGLDALKSSKHFSVVSLLSFSSWLLQAGIIYLLILAFGYNINLAGAVIITAIVNIMMTIVIAPGNIGTFQGATVAAMAPFGIGKSEALAFSFLLHIFVYLPPIILGAFFSFKEGLSFRQLKDEGVKSAEEREKLKELKAEKVSSHEVTEISSRK